MSEEEVFLSEQNPASLRWVILEDDFSSAYLYLTAPGTEEPEGTVFVYNRIPPIPVNDAELYAAKGQSPPVAEGYETELAVIASPTIDDFAFLWSKDGHSVALSRQGSAICCILRGENLGYSKSLKLDGPWGRPWSQNAFDEVFSDE
jgi:hypothetical protein